MPRLFWPNFDFEHELAAGQNWQPTAKLQTLNGRFAAVFLSLCADDDLIVLPSHQPELTAGSENIHVIDEKSVRESDEFLGRTLGACAVGSDRLVTNTGRSPRLEVGSYGYQNCDAT